MEFLPDPNETYRRFNKNNYKTFTINGVALHPLADIKTTKPINFSQELSNYTTVGREKTYKGLSSTILMEIQKMICQIKPNQSIEFLDNSVSKFSMQNGKCAISRLPLTSETLSCHHIIPKHLGGTDMFNNIVIVDNFVHKLIHATNTLMINKCLYILKLKPKQLEKLNKLRSARNLETI